MDLASALKNEFLRPFATLVLPGSVALGPYLFICGYYHPEAIKFITTYPTWGGGLVISAALLVGLVLDDVGDFIEGRFWDDILKRRDRSHIDNWIAYQKLYLRDELIAHRRLREVLTRMKFEMSMAVALIIFYGGALWYNVLRPTWQNLAMFVLGTIIALLVCYLLHESFKSAQILSRTRKIILEAPPPPPTA